MEEYLDSRYRLMYAFFWFNLSNSLIAGYKIDSLMPEFMLSYLWN